MAKPDRDILEVENSPTAKDRQISSRLGSSTKFEGELSSHEDVMIEGSFQGKIDSADHDIHVEKEAVVTAEIHGRNVIVLGHVSGNILASGKITIGKSAVVTGDISAPTLSIQDGARFKGSVKMIPQKT